MSEPFDPYKTLGCDRAATPAELRRAYRRMAKKYHPDRNAGDAEAPARFQAVERAWAVLSDPGRRARYDATGECAEPPRRPAGVDPEEAEVVAALAPILLQLISQAESRPNGFGTPTGVDRTDFAAQMRDHAGRQLEAVREAVRGMNKALAAMEKAAKRFTAPDGAPNHPADILNARVASLRFEIEGAAAEGAKWERVVAYLAGVRYQTDGRPAAPPPTRQLGWTTITLGGG